MTRSDHPQITRIARITRFSGARRGERPAASAESAEFVDETASYASSADKILASSHRRVTYATAHCRRHRCCLSDTRLVACLDVDAAGRTRAVAARTASEVSARRRRTGIHRAASSAIAAGARRANAAAQPVCVWPASTRGWRHLASGHRERGFATRRRGSSVAASPRWTGLYVGGHRHHWQDAYGDSRGWRCCASEVGRRTPCRLRDRRDHREQRDAW